TAKPTDTAGLMWHPEMWPIAYAIVRSESPNAKETPKNPMPTWGNAAASTALPQPANTSQNVPIISAKNLFPKFIQILPGLAGEVTDRRRRNRFESDPDHIADLRK